jgi:glycosyltransferase involved in cell wall biosynthesis
MRVLMVVELLFLGGLETHVMALCRQLMLRKHQVYVHVKHCIGPWRELLTESGAILVDSPEEAGSLDLIHVHAWGKSPQRGILWSQQHDLPLVVTYHGLFKGYVEHLVGKAEIISVSPRVQQYLEVPSTVVENGIELEQFPASPLPFNRTVAWLGRLDGKRWLLLDTLFRACRMSKIRCRVIGGLLTPTAIHLLSVYDHVEWHGAVFNVAPLLRDVDVVFSTSRGIREAMASGRLAIVANDRYYGGLVEPNSLERLRSDSFMAWGQNLINPAIIAEDLLGLYSQPEYMSKVGQWGTAFAKETFSAERMATETEQVYHKALQKTC